VRRPRRLPVASIVAPVAALALLGCAGPKAPPEVAVAVPPVAVSAVAAYEWRLPPGFPEPAVPADNPMTEAKVLLGRHLFHEERLSVSGTLSCAGCHRQELAFTDGRARAVGATGQLHPRGAPSLANAAYSRSLNWADPTLERLEEQLDVPLFNRRPIELGLAGREREVEERLRADPLYRRLFGEAFPAEAAPVSIDNVKRALAAFERTLISGRSAYDRLVFDGDRKALSELAWSGMRLFFSDRLRCVECHSGFTFSGPVVVAGAAPPRPVFHNTGLYGMPPDGRYPVGNRGLFELTGAPEDMGRFKAPTLRNVALTAPYMHDGSLATLEEVVGHYASAGRVIATGERAGDGRSSPHKSPLVGGFDLDAAQKRALIAFLESLTDEDFVTSERFSDPRRPPAGPPTGPPTGPAAGSGPTHPARR
jgi:cytochrome c peroxidase